MTGNNKRKKIILAIPSNNEADNIGALTKTIDKGFSKYFSGYNTIILNADNDSSDGTGKVFLSTPTKSQKIYLTSRREPKKLRGKGFHMRMAFEYAREMNAEAIGFIDGDVSSASPEWIKQLIGPVLEGYDHVLPIYIRNAYDGSITNHLAFPVLYGLLYADLRQPLAGEIAFSRRAIKEFLSKKWYLSAYHFGVDIFLVAQSIFKNLRVVQTFLGVKDHKPSAPKLNPMFVQVADSLFRQLQSNRSSWTKKNGIFFRTYPVLNKPQKSYHPPELPFDYKTFKEEIAAEYEKHRLSIKKLCKFCSQRLDRMFVKNGELTVSPQFWAEIIYYLISRNKLLTQNELSALRIIFFARFLTFYKKITDKTYAECEKEIIGQAKLFRKLRESALK